mmetsp:Transcript_1876/g.5674  ORF Transcript_1876/g.5674 Transcript_1876/m.5674 type:complete len:246 (+) Transcript_1876:451-1188(+)
MSQPRPTTWWQTRRAWAGRPWTARARPRSSRPPGRRPAGRAPGPRCSRAARPWPTSAPGRTSPPAARAVPSTRPSTWRWSSSARRSGTPRMSPARAAGAKYRCPCCPWPRTGSRRGVATTSATHKALAAASVPRSRCSSQTSTPGPRSFTSMMMPKGSVVDSVEPCLAAVTRTRAATRPVPAASTRRLPSRSPPPSRPTLRASSRPWRCGSRRPAAAALSRCGWTRTRRRAWTPSRSSPTCSGRG